MKTMTTHTRRRFVLPGIVLVAALLAGCAQEPQPRALVAPADDECLAGIGAGVHALECEGLRLQLAAPEMCPANGCGVIVDVHGFGMDAQLQDMHTELSRLGPEHGYVVVQPSAPGERGEAAWSPDHDTQVHALLSRVIEGYDLDRDRVHMTGYSQGGFMTWRFLCEHADMLASVAPNAAGVRDGYSCEFAEDRMPASEVPVLQVHGTTDGLVPLASAEAMREAVRQAWALDEVHTLIDEPDYTWTRYRNNRGTVYEFVQFDWETDFALDDRPLGGHCFPGSDAFLGCGADTAFHWGEAVIAFFREHPVR